MLARRPSRRSDRRGAGALALRAGALLVLLGACKMAAPRPAPAAGSEPGVEAAHLATFRALQGALGDEDDELARGILAHLRAQALGAREQELVASAERVLTGRALVRELELALLSEEVPDKPGALRLVLVARSNASAPLTLRLLPADLKRLRATTDVRGMEGIELDSRASKVFDGLELAPQAETRVELWRYELPLGRALAVRERWRMEPRSGEILSAGAHYPAARVKVAGCTRERISPLVPLAEAAAKDLAAKLAASEAVTPLALLELALRVPAAERRSTLIALAPVVARLAREDPERVSEAEPALRWLSENRELGTDAAGWARYLGALAAGGGNGAPAPGGGRLDLPAGPRPARRSAQDGAR